ncbi:PA14 domain-containing protein [Hymenobacter properus]|uniref:OmpA family protein n=1 Tax=Hymenobacter properus TaxID=2791026 RepID=A0A931BHK9_9BACT|nr:PA14 domain-containing protein [Hymenobacter properus]MBF9141457.1 OmpA family protein [Hymenobacter properus]MBR7720266.1 OmpA family protein [Microvirga sp. SRT04]
MSSLNNKRRPIVALLSILLATQVAGAQGQAQPAINGLRGDYYEGTDFEKYVLTRRDATIDFNWGHQPPAPGLPAEDFSVRWTGWLVPPASGEYTFHVTVDDGIRLWVNDKLLLNEWRGQPVSVYTATVTLRAGEPYRLRVDYCQYRLDTRVFVNWELPSTVSSSWRNLWGVAASKPKPVPISAAYLFRSNPKLVARPATPPTPAPKALAPQTVAASKPPLPAPPPRKKPVASALPRIPAPKPVATKRVVPAVEKAPLPVSVVIDSSSTARLTTLAVGEALTLPELYFDQGQARLLPAVRTALDGLAATLRAQPALRFEVQGHTDNVGNAELNRQLSQQRAEVVCLYLTAHGVAAGQLRPVGYGGTQPVADNADPAQRPRNRRVALRRL